MLHPEMKARSQVPLDGGWQEYFDAITAGGRHLKATVELARVSLSPGPADQGEPASRQDGLLAGIRYDRRQDEIEIRIRRRGARGHSVRFFLPAPRGVTIEERDEHKLIRVSDADGVCTEITLVELLEGESGQALSGTRAS